MAIYLFFLLSKFKLWEIVVFISALTVLFIFLYLSCILKVFNKNTVAWTTALSTYSDYLIKTQSANPIFSNLQQLSSLLLVCYSITKLAVVMRNCMFPSFAFILLMLCMV